MVHANFVAEGALEKPDVIGAIFGQTEGLLGSDLEMRELQKEGKIGRIEVELERRGKQTMGKIKVPTALDQSETTLIAAAIETIERIGPSDAQIEVERIEDVRGSKRDYILERAKKLMGQIQGSTDSREISKEIKESARMGEVNLYGKENLPSGDLSGEEIIVVEGRADVLNLMRNGVRNVVAMNGTKLPESIKELSKNKKIILFVDGDRGGKLIIKNVTDNAEIDYIAIAPDGKEVEELTGKEILMNLRKKIKADSYLGKKGEKSFEKKPITKERVEIDKEKLKEISNKNKGTGKALFLDKSLKEMRNVSVKGVVVSLRKAKEKPTIIVIDGVANNSIIKAAEEAGIQMIVAKNFSTTNTSIELLSL